MKTIKAGQTLTARSICNYDCIYTMEILSRTSKMATYRRDGQVRKAKIQTRDGDEYIRPDRWSMAPTFSAI